MASCTTTIAWSCDSWPCSLERFHRAGFFRRHVLVGIRHAPKQIRKGGQIARTVRLEMVQRLQRLAERRRLVCFERLNA